MSEGERVKINSKQIIYAIFVVLALVIVIYFIYQAQNNIYYRASKVNIEPLANLTLEEVNRFEEVIKSLENSDLVESFRSRRCPVTDENPGDVYEIKFRDGRDLTLKIYESTEIAKRSLEENRLHSRRLTSFFQRSPFEDVNHENNTSILLYQVRYGHSRSPILWAHTMMRIDNGIIRLSGSATDSDGVVVEEERQSEWIAFISYLLRK